MGNKAEVAYRSTTEQKPRDQVIANDIIKARDTLLNRAPEEQNSQLTYDPHLDMAVYQTLYKYKPNESPAYKEALRSLDSYTHFQLETLLGERFNVLSSEYMLHIKPDGLYSPQGKELLRKILQRGRDYRRNQGSKVTKREDAEVDGFELVTEPFLMDRKRKPGDSIVSISRPEGPYRKNFYDVFTVVGEGEDQRVRVRRYSSGLSIQDYKEKIPQAGIQYKIPQDPDPAFFLSHPIKIDASPYSNPDKLHAFFHKTHSYMSREDLEKIKQACDPLIHNYLLVLRESPYDIQAIAEKFDGILNGADEAKKRLEEHKKRQRMVGAVMTGPIPQEQIIFTAREMFRFEREEVRQEYTGCGLSIGIKRGGDPMNRLDQALRNLRPSSVSDFGEEDDLGGREFECKVCHHINRRPYNEKIPRCQNDRCPNPTNVAC